MFLRAAIARPKPASSNSPHSTRNKKKSKRKEPLRQYIVKCWWLYFDFKLIIGKCFGFCYADDVHFEYAIKKYKRQFSTAKIKTPSHCGLPWSQRHRYWLVPRYCSTFCGFTQPPSIWGFRLVNGQVRLVAVGLRAKKYCIRFYAISYVQLSMSKGRFHELFLCHI